MAQDLDHDYQRAGFGRTLGFGRKPALLMVDFVDAYYLKDSPLYAGVESARDTAKLVLLAARTKKIPVIYTRVAYHKSGADGGIFYRKISALSVLTEGSPHSQITAELAPESDDLVITKQYASAFFGTSLAATLNAMRVDGVMIAGLTTSGCIRASAVDAMQHGFIPTVIRDAVGDRDARPHEANLFDLAAKYADVITAQETIQRLNDLPNQN